MAAAGGAGALGRPHGSSPDSQRAHRGGTRRRRRRARPAGLVPGWARARGSDGHSPRGGHAARSQRHLLLPVLHEVQGSVGWISPPALGYVCRRLTIPPAEAYGVASFYALFALEPRPPRGRPCLHRHRLHVPRRRGAGRRSWSARSARPGSVARRRVDLAGEPVPRPLRAGSAPRCSRRAATTRATTRSAPRRRADVAAALAGASARAVRAVGRSRRSRASCGCCGGSATSTPTSLDSYRNAGGYAALRRALELGPAGVIREVTESKLLGRGGAAFPTGRKWDAVARNPVQPHYLVCNADESEPGTFKDRIVIENDPFALIEAMTIAGYATGCEHALHLPARRVPAGVGAAGERDRAGPRPRLAGRGRDGLRPPLRHRAAQGRRRLHLRRGDGAVQLDRGLPRRAAQQAAVPGRRRAVRQADRRQQRREPDQRAGHRARAAARRSRGSAPSSPPARGCSACRAASSGPASTRRRSASRCAR